MTQVKRWTRGEFCWYELATTDVAGAKRFYGEMFGWAHEDISMGEMGHYTILKREGQDLAGLYSLEAPMFKGVPPHWLSYVAVDTVDTDAARVVELGGTIYMGPHDVPNVGRMAFLKDPQGAAIAMFQEGGHPGTARWDGAPAGILCWSELMTTDTDAAVAFYTGLFGWGTKCSDMGPMKYTEWLASGRSVGGCMTLPPEAAGVPPHWMNYITVADCDGAARKAEGLGAKVVFGPMDVPSVGRFATLLDPQGAAVSIIKLG